MLKNAATANRILPLLVLVLLGQVPASFAQDLDIFKSSRPFPVEFKFLPDRITDLETLPKEKISDVLKLFLKAEGKAPNREKRNLYNLAIGFLYLKDGDFRKALKRLKSRIIGNFVLEDFRLHFQAIALKELAVQRLGDKKYSRAIEYLLKSIKLRLEIHQLYPESPFHHSLPQDLAETEKLLGDAYYLILNYKIAWQAYRKALMRDFPDNHEHRFQVYLALAKTYESAGNLQEVVDIYTYLLKNFNDPRIKDIVVRFLQKHEKPIIEKKIDAKILLAKYSPDGTGNPTREKRPDSIRSNKTSSSEPYGNDRVRDFYRSLQQSDLEITFAKALTVLEDYPGIDATRKIIKKVNRLIVKYLRKHPWNETIDRITDHYPSKTLRGLAHNLWQEGNSGMAAVLYGKILNQYPLETEACHKALFFLGRIYEDKKEFSKAIRFYKRLLKRYDSGSYTTSALFKIPWIERLQGHDEDAVEDFKKSLDFYNSPRYEHLQTLYPSSPSYLPATHYWLAQTAGALKKFDEKKIQLKKLIGEFPFNFYAVISRGELGMELKELFNRQSPEPFAYRTVGLGDLRRKNLKRAEQLISVGFLKYGIRELSLVTQGGEGDREFLFYLSRLFYLAGEYQQTMRLSWRIIDRDDIDWVSRDLAKGLFPEAYFGEVDSLAKNSKLDAFLVLSLMRQESAFNPGIVSSANAIGLMQLLPSTAREVARSMKREAPDVEQLKNPAVNIPLGLDYLKRLLSKFDHNIALALAAYNAGPKKVKQWIGLRSHLTPIEFIESIPFNETRDYVKKVLRNYYIYLALYKDREIKNFKEILTVSAN